MRTALPVLALLSMACSHATRSSRPEPAAATTVRVQNQNFLDMELFVFRSGQRIRLGMVTGLTTQVFTLRPELVPSTIELQFELHPIGGRANPRTEKIIVRPGDEVELTVPPS